MKIRRKGEGFTCNWREIIILRRKIYFRSITLLNRRVMAPDPETGLILKITK